MTKDIIDQSRLFLLRRDVYSNFKNREIAKIKKGNVAILGMRRLGKTEYLRYRYSLKKQIDKTLFIDFDSYKWSTIDFSKKNDARDKFIESIINILETNKISLCLFDEMQRYPKWSHFIKSLVDGFPQIEFVVTGSDAVNLANSSDQGGGRFKIYYMGTLTYDEYKEFVKTPSLTNYINHFALPEGTKNDDNKKYRNIYEKQIFASKISLANALSVIKAISYNPGINFTRYEAVKWIRENIGTKVSSDQVNNIIDFLIKSQIIISLQDVRMNTKVSAQKRFALYTYDWSLFKLFSQIDKYQDLPRKIDTKERLKILPSSSKVFKNMIISNVFTKYNTDVKRMKILFKSHVQKDKEPDDIDLIIENDNYEIKSFDVLNSDALYPVIAKAKRTNASIIHIGKTKLASSVKFINFEDFIKNL